MEEFDLENVLLDALDEKPVNNPNKPQNGYNNFKKKNTNNLWDKTDFIATPLDSNKFVKSGKTFLMYGFTQQGIPIPDDIVLKFTKIAMHLGSKGYTFRYCGTSTDAIQNSVLSIETLNKETYLGWPGSNKNIVSPTMKFPNEKAYTTAMAYHSAFMKFKSASRALIAAKMNALFGENMIDPVDLLIVYNSTGDTEVTKNTNWKNMGDLGLFIKISRTVDIPLFNIGSEKSSKALMEYLKNI